MNILKDTLKPVIVFDIDDTLLDADTINVEDERYQCEPIEVGVMLYNSLDYLINDPPSGTSNYKGPKEIYFLSARNEKFRELTVRNLAEVLQESPSSINRRLILGGSKFTTWDAKKECIRQLEERGCTPYMVIDDDESAILAYKDHNPSIVTLTISHR